MGRWKEQAEGEVMRAGRLFGEAEGMGPRGNKWVDIPDLIPVAPECPSSPLGSSSKGLVSEGQRSQFTGVPGPPGRRRPHGFQAPCPSPRSSEIPEKG